MVSFAWLWVALFVTAFGFYWLGYERGRHDK